MSTVTGSPSLNQQTDFLKLWAAQAVSLLGSAITGLALPLIAVNLLNATPSEMGLLRASQNLPWLCFGLLAGVWADRLRRRPMLIWTDLGRAVALLLLPLLAFFNQVSLPPLLLCSVLVGTLTVFFDVAHPSLLPSLVKRDQLVAANGRLQLSQAVVQVAGPGLAGLLIQWLTAPVAIIADACSFLFSALILSLITQVETVPQRVKRGAGVWQDTLVGIRFLLADPLLRALVSFAALVALCDTAIAAQYVLFAVRELQIAPSAIGIIWATAGPSAILGATIAGRVAGRLGSGRTIVIAAIGLGCANLLIALTRGTVPVAFTLLILAQILAGFLNPLYMVNQRSLRQARTPDQLQGRVNAAFRLVAFGSMPIGALLGGVLGDLVGLRPTLLLAAIGALLAALWLAFSPLRQER